MDLQIKKGALALSLSLCCVGAFAQKTITGTVKDATGEPLIGVTIQTAKGGGTVTDIDGNFSLSNLKVGEKLTISYVGCKTKIVTVSNNPTLNIVLESSDKSLDEVVVIGYGTMKRRDLTGAVASVTGDKLAQNPVSNIAEALQGQLPGVTVTSQDGRPGASMSIRVRGGGSITQSNDPLFIVDGVQVSSIDDIPADNIESIDVLKDAASTAIYGARGANGVILITTKNAKEGKVNVKYNMYFRVKEKPETYKQESAYDYVLRNWSYATAYNTKDGQDIAKYFGVGSENGNHLDEYKSMGTHNYQDDLLGSSHSWNHDLSISGGTERTKYYATLNYINDKGSLNNTGFRRWNGNVKLTQDINKKLKWNLDARYSEMQFKGAKFEYATCSYNFRPIDTPLGEDDGSLLGMGDSHVSQAFNPVSIYDNYTSIHTRNRMRANNSLIWTPIKGLTGKTELTLGRNWSEQKTWDGGFEEGYSHAKLKKSDGYHVKWTSTINYNVQGLGKDHKLDLLAGNEVLASKSSSTTFDGYGYPEEWDMNTAFGMLDMTNKDPDLKIDKDTYVNNIAIPEHSLSWFGRANYSYLSRYLFTATFRADGSSKFAPNHHWGYFPAAAAAWRISDEPWMKGTEKWLSNLKLRLSFGTAGNDNINSSLWKDTWQKSSTTVDGEIVDTYVPGSMMGNPDLKWETTISRNAGIDFGFWNGKLRGTLDFYWNTTKNILMMVPIDTSTGYTYQFQNVGKTSNKGVELALNYEIVRNKDFNLSFGMTYNFNHNNIDDLFDGVLADTHTNWGSTTRLPYYDYVIRKGNPVGLIQGYKSQGFYTVDDFNVGADGIWTLKPGLPDNVDNIGNFAGAENYKRPDGQKAFPGMAKFADTDNDGKITASDVTIIGKTKPQHTGGFNLSGHYKNLDFTANFTYQIGGKVYNANALHDMMGGKDTWYGAAKLNIVSDCWKMYNVDSKGDLYAVTDPTELKTLNAGAKYALPFAEVGLVTSDFIEDASYLRLQNLSVGYTFPKRWMKPLGISNLRVYATATNLFCITGYSGIDPDVNTNFDAGGNGFPTPNYDYQAYPKTRSWTFGINLSF